MRVCMSVCACIYIYKYARVCVRACVLYIYICVCLCVLYIYMCVFVCVRACVLYLCVYENIDDIYYNKFVKVTNKRYFRFIYIILYM